MKKIGILGGFGPEATLDYYRSIIERYREVKDDGSLPEIFIYSMDMGNMLELVGGRKWNELTEWLLQGIAALHRAGAEFALMSANTPHVVFEQLQNKAPVPLLSIVEETCREARHRGLTRVGLLGTRFTMQNHFYQDVFNRNGITIILPQEEEQEFIHQKLMTEITLGHFLRTTEHGLLDIIKRMVTEDAIQAVVIGCTDLPLVLNRGDFGIPFLNTTKIHVDGVVEYCLSQDTVS